MKLLFLLAFTLLAVNVFSAPANEEDDELLTELLEKEKEAADEPETEKEEIRVAREAEVETEKEEKVSLTEPSENDEPQEMDDENFSFWPPEEAAADEGMKKSGVLKDE